MSRPDYRPFVPAPGQSRISGPTARAHSEARLQTPRAKELFGSWAELTPGGLLEQAVQIGPVTYQDIARASH
jgi:hypothetical protein